MRRAERPFLDSLPRHIARMSGSTEIYNKQIRENQVKACCADMAGDTPPALGVRNSA